MENNNQENETNNSKFKAVSNPNNYKAVYEMDNKPKKKFNFGRTVVVPFLVVLLAVQLY